MNVGIDLGTTNSAVAYVDPREAGGQGVPPIHVLPIPQRTGPDTVEPLRVLPSFLYLGEREEIGAYARDQGALVPTRLVHSAKSWLANPEVDRTAPILPWDSEELARVLSPVEVTSRFLGRLRDAWLAARGTALAEQRIVLTVPASFDAEARELTVRAAAGAGLERLTLLEEPAAAFYAWIARHLAEARERLADGQVVLVVDVGGGTSDFTLLRVGRDADRVEFTRTAVGDHLLLGGDNLDLALAWLVERKLGGRLSLRQRMAVRRQCAAAKERLLSPSGPDRVEVTVAGSGTALVGGARRTDLLRQEVLDLALEGFLPACPLDDDPRQERGSGFRELGLPYVSDPAITRHLAAFVRGAAEHAPGGVDAILFNGGFFVPDPFRERVVDVVAGWFGRRPAVLANSEPDLAVAIGAAYYSYVRATGAGVLIRGGLPRAYYIGLRSPKPDQVRVACLVPRGTEEGVEQELRLPDLQLLANRPVSFRLYSSLTRAADPLGAVIDLSPEEAARDLHAHAPLSAVMRFGRRTEERLVPVDLGARLSETGTLEVWCASRISEHRWRLEFALRKPAAEGGEPERAAPVVGDEALAAARALVRAVFGRERAAGPDELPARLEQALGLARASWPLPAIRGIGDALLEHADGRRASAGHEVRWLNLTGFCLRPGFGAPGDEFRIEQVRRVYLAGLAHPERVENEVQWWILWGRVAGGLNRNQQADLFRRLERALPPPGSRRSRVNPTLAREMWRTAASLELLPVETRIALGDALARTVASPRAGEADVWCLMRLGARRLFYGPDNLVVPPDVAERWIEALLPVPKAAEALAAIARRTFDPARDVAPSVRERVRAALAAHPDADRLLALLDGDEEPDRGALDRMFGEALPAGLVTAADA